MSRFGMTGKLVAKADRERDAHEYIDGLRQEVFEIGEWCQATDRRLKILEDAQRERVTESGVWRVVRNKLDEEAVDWLKWAVRGCAAMGATALLGLCAWILHAAWRGILM